MIETDIFDALETTAEIMKVEFSVNLAQLPEKKRTDSLSDTKSNCPFHPVPKRPSPE